MMKQISVKDLCIELERKLSGYNYSDDSMRRYKKVFSEFIEYAGDCNYTQSKGTDFLVLKFQQLGGFVSDGEHSKSEMYYFRAIRTLAEYFNFGILFRRNEFRGEIIWPEPFKESTETFLRQMVEYGNSYKYVKHCCRIIKTLILFLDASGVHTLNGITSRTISRFIQSLVGLEPVTIASCVSALRQYFRFSYLNKYVDFPIETYLPRTPQRIRTKLPTVWTEEEIERIIGAVDFTNPIGKRDYAMILLGARLGLRFGDIRNIKLTDIDWGNKQIRISQNKTMQELVLPLSDDIGWALIDYLKNGRPVTDCANVFVIHNAPYTGSPITCTLRNTITKILKRANINIEKTKRYGWHSLRHSLASNLLQNNVDVSIISDILGHSDPMTAKHYLRVNMNSLAKCALEVEVMDYVKE
jgi:site-specific recombinase XerD